MDPEFRAPHSDNGLRLKYVYALSAAQPSSIYQRNTIGFPVYFLTLRPTEVSIPTTIMDDAEGKLCDKCAATIQDGSDNHHQKLS